MSEQPIKKPYFDIIIAIVNIGKASKVLAEAKKIGITGGTITLGLGTVNSGLLRKLGLHEVRKEVLMMVSERKNTVKTIDHIHETFHLDQPNKGIIFSTPLSIVVGTHGEKFGLHETDPIEEATHELFISIVPEEDGDTVVNAVKSAGGAGGTILYGLGAFAETVIKVFGIEISSEKAVVLNLVDKSIADQVEHALEENINYSDKDSGLLFSIDAQHVRGIYERDL
ncbi:MAG TPA: hypothetical protein H9946_05500 [Candidatus Jeotgalibaca pullicola]|nr:hypothetical protein [Candidatus Jeotgalibaca pullicola]